MEIDKIKFAFVSEKIISGVNYAAYRHIDDPTIVYISIDGDWQKVDNLKEYWSKL